MSRDPIEACEGENIEQINVFLEVPSLETKGNRIDQGGYVNWDDGGPEEGIFGTNSPPYAKKLSHTYNTAKTYYPSATYAQQFAYTGDGSCGYRCRVQVSDVAIVYLKNSPECATGKFKPTTNSESRKIQALDTFLNVLMEREKQELQKDLQKLTTKQQ